MGFLWQEPPNFVVLLKLYKYIIFNILLYIISLHAKDHLPPLVRLVSNMKVQ